MSDLTFEDQERLSAPFDLSEHAIREGRGGEWYVYLTERPIRSRLSDVDPGWHFEHDTPEVIPPVGGGDSKPFVRVTARLTIKGVTRSNEGTATPRKEFDENVPKAAVTDALRRAARMFDVGGYILDAPKIKQGSRPAAVRFFSDWYLSVFGGDDAPIVNDETGEIVPLESDDYDPLLDDRHFNGETWDQLWSWMVRTLPHVESKPHAVNTLWLALGEFGDGFFEEQDLNALFAKVVDEKNFKRLYKAELQVRDIWHAISAYYDTQLAEQDA
ncbi:MAG: Rad52/Rad22 family DNA repair protein [Planctomycetota bacterium]|jgi:hypothetical protein